MLTIIKSNKLRENVFFYSLLAVLFSIPLDYGFSSVAIIIFILSNIFFGFFHEKQVKLTYLLLLSIYLLGGLSYFWSAYPDLTVKALGREVSLFLVPITLMFSPVLSKAKFFSLWRLVSVYLVGLFVSLLSVAVYKKSFFGLNDFFFYHDLTSPLLMNAIFMSFLVAICILIIASNLEKIVSLEALLVLVLFIFLVLLSSKLVLVLTSLGLVIQLIFKKITLKWVVVLLASFIAVIMLVKPVQERFLKELSSNYTEVLEKTEFGQVYPWNGTTIRLLQIRVGNEILSQEKSWKYGVGLGASQPFIAENQAKKKMYVSYGVYNFHNQYVQILVELGIVGLALYLSLICFLIFDFRQNIMVLSIILLIFGLGITESFLWRQRGLLTFLMVFATIYKFSIKER